MGKLRSKFVIDSGTCDVIKSDWLWDCSQTFRLPKPSDMVVTTAAMEEEFTARKFDAFGDSHVEEATADSLRLSMGKVSVTDDSVGRSNGLIRGL